MHLVFQVHWNNPLLVADTTDSSGLRIYHTPHLRQYDLSVMPIGPFHIVIPPQRESYSITGICRKPCTNTFDQPYYVNAVFPHMHYAGVFSIFQAQIQIY